MKTVLLSMSGAERRNTVVAIDDQVLRFQPDKNGTQTCTYLTDKDEVMLSVTRISEMRTKNWFWWGLLYFFLSCFGLFNSHYDKSGKEVHFQVRLTLNEVTNLRITFNKFAENTRALECVRDCPGEEYDNIYTMDKRIKKRCRLLGLVEFFLWVGLLALVAYLVVKKIIGF